MNRRRAVSAGSRGTAVLSACAAALLIATPASAGRLLGPVLRASGPVLAPPASRSAAAASPLTYHGGHVMQTSTVHAIYWTGGMSLPAGYRTTIDRYLADVATDSGKTSNVYAAATEYYQTIAGATSHIAYQTSFPGSVVDTTAFVSHCTLPISPAGEMCVTDADIQARVIANAIANGWPSGASDAYVVITPPGMGICYATNQCSDNVFCAYHSWTGPGPGEGDVTTRYVYAVEPYQQDVGGCDLPANPNGAPADITINTISHEHNEMLTDPFGAGWLDASGLEIADKCRTFNPAFDFGVPIDPSGFNQLINGHAYELQGEWSNAMGGCFQIGPPTLASATPSAGGAGTAVGISGTNFFNVGSLKFNGTTAAKTVDSPTHLTATVPSGATPGALSLATDFGTATTGFSFSVPVIVSGFAPSSGPVGTSVTISGSGFTGVKSVKFTGLGGTGVSSSFTVSGGTITAKVPSAAVSGPITIVTSSVSAQSSDSFAVGPSVSSFTPTVGGVGASVTVNGTGFDSTSVVRINGTATAMPASWTANKIVVPVPDGATSGQLTVTTQSGAGGPAAAPGVFRVAPKITTNVAALHVRVGDTVDLSGFNLDEVTSVKIGAVAAPSFTHDVGDPTHVLHVVVPDTALTGRVVVQSASGTFSTAGNLGVRPTISSFSAPSGPTGTTVTLNGNSFNGTTSVKFTGFTGTQTVATGFSVLSRTALRVTIPGTAVSGPILVGNAGGTTTSGVFHVTPRIVWTSPGSGVVGTSVTVSGSGFDSTSVVRINGAAVTMPGSWTANKIVVAVPDGATTGPISVTTESGAGGPASTTSSFKVGPKLATNVSAMHVRAGDTVDLTGFDLDGVTTVKIGGVAAATVVHDAVDPAHILHFVVPDAAATGRVSAQSPDGTSTTSGSLGVRPTLDSFSSPSGTTGASVTLTGNSFSGTNSVKFTGIANTQTVPASFSVLSRTSLRVTVPGSAVSGPLLVTNAGGSTLSGTFSVVPRITGFSPASGPTGAVVTVSGSGFDSSATLAVGGTGTGGLDVQPTSPTSVRLHVPDGVDNGKLTVTTGGGTSGQSSMTYSVTASILSFPSSGHAGDALTILGKGLGSAPVVTVAGQPATVTAHTPTQITVTIPATLGSGPITVNNGSVTLHSAGDFTITAATQPGPGPIRVSSNGRYLVDEHGNPWLMAGESPQAMIGNLTLSDAEAFFAKRQSQGFNTVWVNLLCVTYTGCNADGTTWDGIAPFTATNADGSYDLAHPNEAYFARADAILQLAQQYGFVVLLDPIETGGWVNTLGANGIPKDRAFGQYLGTRYKNFPNIIWMSGNDYQPWTWQDDDPYVTAVAKGIADTDASHLQTVELNYYTSGSPDDPTWIPLIQLDAAYTYDPTYKQVLTEYNRASPLPTFMVEATYEFEQNNPSIPFGSPLQLRKQEYWTLLSGATGQLYGNKYTWPFTCPSRDASGNCLAGNGGWKDNLDTPGANQMAYVTSLFGSRHWWELVPDQNHTLVTAGFRTFGADDYVTAARTPDGKLAMAYLPTSGTITVDLSQLSGAVTARWYDPSAGTYTPIAGSPFANTGSHDFASPGPNHDGDGDWVLVLEAP